MTVRIFCSLVLVAGRAFASGVAMGGALLDAPFSVRQVGMGGVGPGGSDVLRAWTNPSLLREAHSASVLALGGGSAFDNTQLQTVAGYRWVAGPAWAFALIGARSSMSMVEVDAVNRRVGTIGRVETAGGFTAMWCGSWLRAGATIKGASHELDRRMTSMGAADLGVAGTWGGLTAAVSARNLGSDLAPAASLVRGADASAREMRGGLAYHATEPNLVAGVEVSSVASQERTIGGGAEIWVNPRFGVRGGFVSLLGGAVQNTAGFSVIVGVVGLDYALATHPLGLTHMVGLNFAFRGSPAAVPHADSIVPPPPPGPAAASQGSRTRKP